VPTINDLLALAPTKPITISRDEIGAANISYMDPENFGIYIPKELFEILCCSRVSISSPGTINDP